MAVELTSPIQTGLPIFEVNEPVRQAPPQELAPMLRQYVKIQEEHPDHLVFIQVGDFYEVFYESAVKVSEILNIRLTSRDKSAENRTPMCGVPIRAFESYLPKILIAGYRAVVVSQTEEEKNPKTGKSKSFKREITRIVTPGIRLEEGLNERNSNFCGAAIMLPEGGAICAYDISTGQLKIKECESQEELFDALERFRIREIILPSTMNDRAMKGEKWLSELKSRIDGNQTAQLNRAFRDSAVELEFIPNFKNLSRAVRLSLVTLFDYAREVSCGRATGISSYYFEKTGLGSLIDASTLRNLEILETRIDGDRKYSVIAKIDRTVTAMGSRTLQDWLTSSNPGIDLIRSRHGFVASLVEQTQSLKDLREELKKVKDLERLLAKVAAYRSSPQELATIRDSIETIPRVLQILRKNGTELSKTLINELPELKELASLLSSALVPEPPFKLGEQPCFKDSYHSELARLKGLCSDVGQRLLELESRERVRSGIPSLKVKQAMGFGYSFEVSRTNAAKVPSDFERRQTLTNVERFVTPELKIFEAEILTAEDDAAKLERELFTDLQLKLSNFSKEIKQAALTIAEIDVLSSFAELAVEQNYSCPVMTDGEELQIEGGRHPVVEQVIGGQNFIANNTNLNGVDRRFALLTGPNMGGKSTYLRQIGLIQLLAQIGSFVPAKSATLGVVDRIFTRIGASDDLSRGESTFMVEMRETSTILRRSTKKSLVLIDEVGRGTATSDGRAIALSVSDYLLDSIGCRTVFATHFHELTTLLAREGVFCLAVGVEEIEDQIFLTHRILEQVGDKSYGIEVAKLAGLPGSVIERAVEYLSLSDEFPKSELKLELKKTKPDVKVQKFDDLVARISGVDLNSMTPIEGMLFLNSLKDRYKS
jgi:DNA mismatch repair protein MutS